MDRDSSTFFIPDNTRRAKITGYIKRSRYQVYLEYEDMNPKIGGHQVAVQIHVIISY
jgi:hypothetical protein